MNIFVDILIGLIGATLVLADRANYVIDENGVKVVNVQVSLIKHYRSRSKWIKFPFLLNLRIISVFPVSLVSSETPGHVLAYYYLLK